MIVTNDRKVDGKYRIELTVPEYHDLLQFLEQSEVIKGNVLNLKYLVMAIS